MKTEKEIFADITDDFISSYSERDTSIGFPDWLADRLQQEMPDMSAEASKNLSAEIIGAVAEYDRTLGDLNKALESGRCRSKEEWLADRMIEASDGIVPYDEAGANLQQLKSDFYVSNMELMQEGDDYEAEIVEVEDAETVSWNEYSLLNEALEVGSQAVMSGLAVMTDVIKANIQDEESTDIGKVARKALLAGWDATKSEAKAEMKAVIAGAVKSASAKGLTSILPSDTPEEIEVIGDIAGAAVESAEALYDVAMGNTTAVEAMDKVGRASVAVACRQGARLLKGAVTRIPFIGPPIAWLADGLFEHMESPKFAKNIYNTVSDATKATWEGIKQKGKAFVSGIKNLFARETA
jgi:hypothetical protein